MNHDLSNENKQMWHKSHRLDSYYNNELKNEIVLYLSNELPERIEVRIEDDTVWLNRQQLAVLFGRDVKTIGKYINNHWFPVKFYFVPMGQCLCNLTIFL
jgi:hypothetical protein